MKRFSNIIAVLVCSIPCLAQNVEGCITVHSREDLLTKLPPEAVYLFPEYRKATVNFRNGQVSSGRVNICLVDNSVRIINSTGDTLILWSSSEVNRIYAGDTAVLNISGIYVKQLAAYGSISLVERKRFEMSEAASDGGYSGIPATSTARKGNVAHVNHSYIYDAGMEFDYTCSTEYALTDGEKLYPSRASSFKRMFPSAKKSISSYIRKHDVDFTDKADLATLFLFCADNDK